MTNSLLLGSQSKRVRCIRIALQQRRRKSIDGWCIGTRTKRYFAGEIGGFGIDTEIVIETAIFLENNHEMLDGCGRSTSSRILRISCRLAGHFVHSYGE